MTVGRTPAAPIRRTNRRAMPAIAVDGHVLASWASALMTPLALPLDDTLGRTPMEQALAVSLPVVAGTLGRVPIGALTHRFGARFPDAHRGLATCAAGAGLSGNAIGGFTAVRLAR